MELSHAAEADEASGGPQKIPDAAAEYFNSGQRLHRYMMKRHWTGSVVAGPDPGIRLNARFGRFVKSIVPFVPWSDELVYMQSQAYWIMNNWLLYGATGDETFRSIAVATSDAVLERQLAAGYWEYPNPEWRGRIATVEGCFAALGLLDSYDKTSDARYLEAALAWYAYMKLGVGFRSQEREDWLAVNYFAHVDTDGGGVPNNSTLVLWLLARLYETTENDSYLDLTAPLAQWLSDSQLGTGELPYLVGATPATDRIHFLCQQYNAFEFMDLAHYYRITKDETVWPLMKRLAAFLSEGFTQGGYARYDCGNERIEVTYYTAALAQALQQATTMGLGDFAKLSTAGYERVIGQQRADGGFRFYSRGNYLVLQDRRSYPRYLGMILHHLLLAQPDRIIGSS